LGESDKGTPKTEKNSKICAPRKVSVCLTRSRSKKKHRQGGARTKGGRGSENKTRVTRAQIQRKKGSYQARVVVRQKGFNWKQKN